MKRFVTGTDAAGKSVFASIGAPPRTTNHVYTPGFCTSVVWVTAPGPVLPNAGDDQTLAVKHLVPSVGGTSLIILTIPPDSVMMTPGFDLAKALAEHAEVNPDVTNRMDPKHPGMHSTDSVDYIIVMEGEIWAELDNGREERLARSDVLIQNGTRHKWSNKGTAPAVLAVFLVGANVLE